MCHKLLIYHPIAFGKDKVLQEGARSDETMTYVTGGAFVCFGGCVHKKKKTWYGLVQISGLFVQRS